MIDLMGSRTFDAQTIAVHMQALINGKYRPAQREQLTRGNAAQQKELSDFYKEMSAEKARIESDNALLIATLSYEAAQRRLALDALDNADYPDYKDEDGKFARHPDLVTDDVDRADAQATVDVATPEVLALVEKRLPVEVSE